MQLRMPSLAVLTLVLLAASELVVAQIMGPDCNVTMDWSFNSLGQSPCIVAAYMLATCNSSVFILQPLQPGNSYTVSDGSIFDNCLCTSVAYNLLSVCDACQGQNWRAWSNYSSNCLDRLTPLPFPYTVPLGTRVPQWASVDHTLEENWNATTAGIGTQPNLPPFFFFSTSDQLFHPGVLSSDTPETEPGSFIGPSGSTSPIPTGDDFSSSNGPSTGTIVGSIVGGVAALATIGALLFYFLRKRRRSQVLSAVVDDSAPPMSQEPPPLSAGDESDETDVPRVPEGVDVRTSRARLRRAERREPKREHADYSAGRVYAGLPRPAYRLSLGKEEVQLSFSRHHDAVVFKKDIYQTFLVRTWNTRDLIMD
ncbi:hypothetical protein EDB85DRAFT_414907 [Lactarius pseudohatsudake]|nr:hypothetical protein EDB85DRAFT_414907 [Lactarius pseudohatsudake]